MITPSDDKMRCTVVAIDGGRDSNIGASVDTGNGIKSAVCRISIPPGIVDGGHDDFEDDGTEWKPDLKNKNMNNK